MPRVPNNIFIREVYWEAYGTNNSLSVTSAFEVIYNETRLLTYLLIFLRGRFVT